MGANDYISDTLLYFQLINELRLRIPISERGAIIKEAENVASENTHEEHHAQNALKVAQSTVESLKVLITSYLVSEIKGTVSTMRPKTDDFFFLMQANRN